MKDILEYLGITGGILAIIVIVILNADKIYIVLSFIAKPFSFIKIIRRGRVSFENQGKINSICGRVAANFFDKKLRIKWLSKKAFHEKPYSLVDEEEIVVYVHHKKNSNQVIVDVLNDYVAMTLYPNLKYSIDTDFTFSNKIFITNKIIDEYKNPSLTHLYRKNYFENAIDIKKRSYLEQIQLMHNNNYYFKVFLDALKQVDEKFISTTFDSEVSREVLSFFDFVLTVSQKGRDEKVDLTFLGKYIKYSIILVAKEETLSVQGLDAHIKRIKACRNQLVHRIYISGYGKKNIVNVKKITHIVKKLRALNVVFEGNYDIATADGKIRPFRLVVVDNMLVDIKENNISDIREVEQLLDTYIPEINSGKIEIVSIAREKGYGTKILVKSTEGNFRPIGPCVGPQGERKNTISSKLNDEMIHFVEQTEDIKQVIIDSLYPLPEDAVVRVLITSSQKSSIVIVKDGEVGRAVGKFGINVKLVQDLIGWKIDVKKESENLDT